MAAGRPVTIGQQRVLEHASAHTYIQPRPHDLPICQALERYGELLEIEAGAFMITDAGCEALKVGHHAARAEK